MAQVPPTRYSRLLLVLLLSSAGPPSRSTLVAQNAPAVYMVATIGAPSGTQWFGASTAADGDTMVIGGYPGGLDKPGYAFVYQREASIWVQKTKLQAPQPVNGDQFGYSLAISGIRSSSQRRTALIRRASLTSTGGPEASGL